MRLHKRYHHTDGYTRLVERGEMGLTRLEFGMLNLRAGGAFFEDTADNEVALIVLGGRCELLVGHNGNKAHGIIGERPNVFHGEAYRAYIPHRTTYELLAHHEVPVEVALCKAPSHLETAAAILGPGDDFDKSDHTLIIGENPIPSISGEAIYFYRFDPVEGCANQRIHNEDRSFDQVISARHNDVLALPQGYHAVSLESRGRLYCLWISFGGNEPIDPRKIRVSHNITDLRY